AITDAVIRNRSIEILQFAAQLLLKWNRVPELARIQGASGVLLGWRVSEPLAKDEATRIVESVIQRSATIPVGWRSAGATNTDSRANLGWAGGDKFLIGLSEFVVADASQAEFRLSSSGALDVWLNGKIVHH